MFVTKEALNWAHPNSVICGSGTERKQRRLLVEGKEDQMGRVFLAYWKMLTAVSLFRYLV